MMKVVKLTKEVPLKELDEAELERLVRGWRREAVWEHSLAWPNKPLLDALHIVATWQIWWVDLCSFGAAVATITVATYSFCRRARMFSYSPGFQLLGFKVLRYRLSVRLFSQFCLSSLGLRFEKNMWKCVMWAIHADCRFVSCDYCEW